MRLQSGPETGPQAEARSGPARPEPAATVLVALDGSQHALVALPVAQTLARLQGAVLHVLHVGEPLLPPRELLDRLGLTPEQLRGSVLDQRTGSPAEAIARAAEEWRSKQIVLCTHTCGEPSERALGSVAEEVLYLAPCPVVLVRPERGMAPWELRRILLPSNGTPTTAAAVHPALDLADLAQAELHVLHVAAPVARQVTEPGTLVAPRYVDHPHYEWPAWEREFLERLRGLGHPPERLRMQLHLAAGDPGREIVRFARGNESDLIILAWRGHFEAERARTMKAVIRAAPCPVLVLRAEARPAG